MTVEEISSVTAHEIGNKQMKNTMYKDNISSYDNLIHTLADTWNEEDIHALHMQLGLLCLDKSAREIIKHDLIDYVSNNYPLFDVDALSELYEL